MKKILHACLFLGVALFLVACQQETTSTNQETTTVVSESIDWEQAGPDAKANQISFEHVAKAVEEGAVFYDVRSESEFNAQNFGITTNYPISKFEAGELPDLSKDHPIYLHCQLGIRSATATKILREAGFTNVYDLGGITHVEAIGGQLSAGE